jgi:hypothetical protein
MVRFNAAAKKAGIDPTQDPKLLLAYKVLQVEQLLEHSDIIDDARKTASDDRRIAAAKKNRKPLAQLQASYRDVFEQEYRRLRESAELPPPTRDEIEEHFKPGGILRVRLNWNVPIPKIDWTVEERKALGQINQDQELQKLEAKLRAMDSEVRLKVTDSAHNEYDEKLDAIARQAGITITGSLKGKLDEALDTIAEQAGIAGPKRFRVISGEKPTREEQKAIDQLSQDMRLLEAWVKRKEATSQYKKLEDQFATRLQELAEKQGIDPEKTVRLIETREIERAKAEHEREMQKKERERKQEQAKPSDETPGKPPASDDMADHRDIMNYILQNPGNDQELASRAKLPCKPASKPKGPRLS